MTPKNRLRLKIVRLFEADAEGTLSIVLASVLSTMGFGVIVLWIAL